MQDREFKFVCEHLLEAKDKKELPWLAEVLYVTENSVEKYTTIEEAEANGMF